MADRPPVSVLLPTTRWTDACTEVAAQLEDRDELLIIHDVEDDADDFEAFETALEDDLTVESMTMLSETAEERSYQMTRTDSIDFIVYILTEHEGTITHVDRSTDGWELRVMFPDQEPLSEAYDAAHEAGLRFDVTPIYGTEDPRSIQHGLTDTQQEALVAAFEARYFTVPREVTLHELAEQQDSSHQALSEQLHRATGTLVESTLITHSETTDE